MTAHEKTSDDPKYRQVMAHIESLIRRGVLADGALLPSENTLAGALSVSRVTVREALERLQAKGVVSKGQGKRSTINASALRGTGRPLKFGWIGRSPIRELSVYFGIYSQLQKRISALNGALIFLPMLNVADEKLVIAMLESFDGIFLAGVRSSGITPELAELLARTPHSVEIDDIGNTPAAVTVCTDNYDAGKRTAEYIRQHRPAARVVALLSDRAGSYHGYMNRIRGFLDGFAGAELAPSIWNCSDDLVDRRDITGEAMRMLELCSTADTVWHPSDGGAWHFRTALEQLRPKVDWRSAGIDGMEERYRNDPRHLTVRHPVEEIAQVACTTMLDLLENDGPETKCKAIAGTLLPWNC
ncbi:MAG: GntR family transcriptional regulator [Victivallaceae bacterium]|nr:GntR family transcriptional regulator [Victivallaceae bacterium]